MLDFGQCMEALAVLAEENGLNEIRPAVWGERVAGISVREVSRWHLCARGERMSPSATRVSALKLLVHEALRCYRGLHTLVT